MPTAGDSTPRPRVMYPALDGLRASAFLMVFLQHYYQLPWGFTGVNIFFVLSGFLITGILWDTRNTPHRARIFYIRRTLRIFPLYYGIFLLALLAEPIYHWQWSALWFAWPLYLGNFLRFLPQNAAAPDVSLVLARDASLFSAIHHTRLGLGHLWSLCVEEQFYLAWPWVVFASTRRRLLGICATVVVLTPMARLLTQHNAPPWMLKLELLYRFTPFQLDSLLLGGLVAILWRGAHRETLLRLSRWIAALTLLAAVLYLGYTLHLVGAAWRQSYPYPSWRFTWGLTFVNILAASVIVCSLQTSGLVHRLLTLRPLPWIGRISYGAYVFHDIFHSAYAYSVSHLLYHFSRPHPWAMHLLWPWGDAIVAGVSLLATLLLAWLSFRFFESPFLRLKNRLAPTSAATA